MEHWMMYRDSLAVSLCAHCAQFLLLVQSTTQLCMRYSKKWVLNTQPVLVAIEMWWFSMRLILFFTCWNKRTMPHVADILLKSRVYLLDTFIFSTSKITNKARSVGSTNWILCCRKYGSNYCVRTDSSRTQWSLFSMKCGANYSFCLWREYGKI
jgi:hypothetical protein